MVNKETVSNNIINRITTLHLIEGSSQLTSVPSISWKCNYSNGIKLPQLKLQFSFPTHVYTFYYM